MNFILILFCSLNIFNLLQCSKIVTQRLPSNIGATTTTTPKNDDFDVQKFLKTQGYDLGNSDKLDVLKRKFFSYFDMQSNPFFKKMIKLFQKFHNLNATGVLDAETKQKMTAPRCGVPDLRHNSSALAAYKAISKWGKTNLTFRFSNYTQDLGPYRTRVAITTAFQYWADVTPLTFTEVNDTKVPVDLVIEFGSLAHSKGSCPYPFDGQGGTLAHGYFPRDGRIHFDEDEYFTEDGDRGTNLRIVAAHEIGHSLGLDHSFTQEALMYPYYQYVPKLTLHEDDIWGIQSLYGKRSANPSGDTTPKPTLPPPPLPPSTQKYAKGVTFPPTISTTTTTTTTTTKQTTTTKATTPNPNIPNSNLPPCVELNEAVFLGSQNDLYVLIDHENLWKYDLNTKKWTLENLLAYLPQIETNVRGGAVCNKNYTWFFKGRKVWAYNDTQLLPGFPTIINDPLFPSNPYTAVNKNGAFYVLKGNLAYKFNTTTLTVIDYPDYVSNVFKGLPNWIEAAVNIDGEHYMFKDIYVYKFDEPFTSVLKDYPKRKDGAWFPCLNETAPAQMTTFNVVDYYEKLCQEAKESGSEDLSDCDYLEQAKTMKDYYHYDD